jgi:hypothetical protein
MGWLLPYKRLWSQMVRSSSMWKRRITKALGKVEGPGETLNPCHFTVYYVGQRRQFLHEAGVPAAAVRALIGHDSEAVHDLYECNRKLGG